MTAAARFLILVIAARSLSPSEFGSFAFFVGCALVVGSLAELSLGRTLVRFVGVAHGEQNPALAKQFSVAVLQSKILLSVPILAIGLIAIGFGWTSLNATLVLWALAVGLLTSFGPLVASVFQVQGKFRDYFLAYTIDAVRFAAILVLLILGQVSVRNLLYVFLLSPVVLVLLWPAMGLRLGALFQPASVATHRHLWTFGKWIFLITLLDSLWQRLDVLMLEALGGPSDVGIYSGVYMFMGVAALVSTSVTTLIYPRMAEAHGRKDPAELANQYVSSTNVMAYLGLPCVLGITALAPGLVGTTIGNAYSPGLKLFPWLAVYGVFLILQMNTGAVFWSVGKPAFNFCWSLTLILSGMIGNLLLIPRWHAEGAAAVLAASTVLAGLLSWSGVAYCLGVWPDFRRIGLFSLSAGLMYLAVRFFPLPFSGVGELMIRVVIGIIVYFGAIKITCGGVSAPLADMAETC
jgi:O-antigen/teichoic acid export membrane protein